MHGGGKIYTPRNKKVERVWRPLRSSIAAQQQSGSSSVGRGDDRKGRPYANTAKHNQVIPPRDQLVCSSMDVSESFTFTQND